ncbi:MAG: peptidoglycan-binding protein, partial [Myxococcales bacterium]|nr:peptidoglycan-binding protein [Myxococcales bacterium]
MLMPLGMGDLSCTDYSCTFTLNTAAAPIAAPALAAPPPEPAPEPAVVVEPARAPNPFDAGRAAMPRGRVMAFQEPLVVEGARPRRYRPGPAVEEVAAGTRSARIGDRGPAVRKIQRALIATGHPVEEDGLFGPKTRAAVMAFQRARGLEEDQGRVGAETYSALSAGLYDATEASTEGLTPEVAGRAAELVATTRLAEFDLVVGELVRSGEFRGLGTGAQLEVLEDIGREPNGPARWGRAERMLKLADHGVLRHVQGIWAAVGRASVPQA